jgi:HK97 family phage major capsid protein
MYVGDFSKAIIALRQGVQVEITNTGGDAFAKHQVMIKAHWRGGFAALQGKHFVNVSGVS